MAYENGKQINQYANMKTHKEKLRKRFSKWVFDSHENYEQACDKLQEAHDNLYGISQREQRRRNSGYKPYYRRYWRMKDDDGKKNAKHFQHRAMRSYYRKQLSNVDVEEGVDKIPDNRLVSMWNWMD